MAKKGEILLDKTVEGLRFVVVQGPASLCAYVELPKEHPLYGRRWSEEVVKAIKVHGNVTYSERNLPKAEGGEKWWLGWDYAHGGDRMMVAEDVSPTMQKSFAILGDEMGGIVWTAAAVEQDSREGLKQIGSMSAKSKGGK